ncbi:MAG: SufD family Fe-S cluster assembly protein [Methanomassiliicoccaceae archaeon]|jgi:Fe-S cluster assembly scaffold protein SufB|nr:SufD family Fe-S cluster assembly protein [Methanomassiliicoccaceae archaeon]
MQNGKDVKESLNKKANYGPDVNLDDYKVGTYTPEITNDIDDVSDDVKKRMVNVGVMPCKTSRSGTIFFIDNGPSYVSSESKDLELLPIREAAKKYDLSEYLWKAVDPGKDKYTSKTYLEDSDGYFIRVKAGKHIKTPVQTCMLLNRNKQMQNLHNIIIVEENASLEVITGCTTGKHAHESLHVGVSETYVKDGGSLKFSMIHNWSQGTHVRPRSGCIVGRNAKFVNNYIILNKVGSVQSYPATYLNGEGASAKYSSICLGHEGSDIDMGCLVELNAPGTSAEIISRSITLGGRMVARGRLVGRAPGVKAHLECRSLVLNDAGLTLAVPELESTVADVEMTHEAAVGKIARDQVEYLMMRGLTEDEAVGMIVRGFLEGGISGLPPELKKDIDDAIAKANLGS